MSEAATATGAVTGAVRILLRLEGLALLASMVLVYALWGGSWWVFVLLLLLPDISLAAYLAGPGTGAIVYSAAHTTVLAAALAALGLALSQPLMVSLAIIWLAHIGMDRAVGYGLKYEAGFGFTHLGRIGTK